MKARFGVGELITAKWFAICFFLLIANLAASLLYAQANPLNIMVEHLTFTRPEKWKWEPATDASTAVARLLIPNAKGDFLTDVRFYKVKKDTLQMQSVWKTYILESNNPANVEEKRVKIGGKEIAYLKLHGTYQFKKTKKRPGYTLRAADITDHGKHIHVRLVGPQEEIKEATAEYKKMIEDALQE